MPLDGEVRMFSGKSDSMAKGNSRVEAATRWQNVEIRVGSRRGVGGGRDGRKGWVAWSGPMPAGWIDWWIREPTDTTGLEELWRAVPVPGNRDAIYLYAETIPASPEEVPVWKLIAQSLASAAETPTEDAETTAGHEQLRDLVLRQSEVEGHVGALRREMEQLEQRRDALMNQTKDAESRCALAQQSAETAQRHLLQERDRVQNELVALQAYLKERRETAAEDEKQIQERTRLALAGVSDTVAGLKEITSSVLQADAIQMQMLVNRRLKAATTLDQSLDLDEALAAKAQEIRKSALENDSSAPSAGAKLAEAAAGIVNQNTLGQLLQFGYVMFGKTPPTPG